MEGKIKWLYGDAHTTEIMLAFAKIKMRDPEYYKCMIRFFDMMDWDVDRIQWFNHWIADYFRLTGRCIGDKYIKIKENNHEENEEGHR